MMLLHALSGQILVPPWPVHHSLASPLLLPSIPGHIQRLSRHSPSSHPIIPAYLQVYDVVHQHRRDIPNIPPPFVLELQLLDPWDPELRADEVDDLLDVVEDLQI